MLVVATIYRYVGCDLLKGLGRWRKLQLFFSAPAAPGKKKTFTEKQKISPDLGQRTPPPLAGTAQEGYARHAECE